MLLPNEISRKVHKVRDEHIKKMGSEPVGKIIWTAQFQPFIRIIIYLGSDKKWAKDQV